MCGLTFEDGLMSGSSSTGGRTSMISKVPFRVWIAVVIVVLVAVFIGQNRSDTSIELFWVRITSPLWFILLVLFLLGGAVGLVFGRRGRGQ